MFDPALVMPEYLVRFEFIYMEVRRCTIMCAWVDAELAHWH